MRKQITCGCGEHNNSSLSMRDCENWVCQCGNKTEDDGFRFVNKEGASVEPIPTEWTLELYACNSCDEVYLVDAFEIRSFTCEEYDLEEALIQFSAAARRLSFVWEKASIRSDYRRIEDIMAKEYPFADSFDETVGRIMFWKDSVIEALEKREA